MKKMRRITVRLPRQLLENEMKASGKGITETIRYALESLIKDESYLQFRASRKNAKPHTPVKPLRYKGK